MRLRGTSAARIRAKQLRRELSKPEVLLWIVLKTKPAALHFRKQHAAGPYLLDFYCAKARLAIEVDGEAHGFGERPERDEARDHWLAAQGVLTVRIPAREVLANLDGSVSWIVHHALARMTPSDPASRTHLPSFAVEELP